MCECLRNIVVSAVYIFVFLSMLENVIGLFSSANSYTGENTVQPVQHLLFYSGHGWFRIGVSLIVSRLTQEMST